MLVRARIVATVAIAWVACSAGARADEAPGIPEKLGDFAVRFIQYDVPLSDKMGRLDSTVKQISFGFTESFSERVRAGLFGGYSYLSQDNDPPTEGEQLDGWHAGILFEVTAYRSPRLALTTGAQYMYQRVDEDNLTSPVEYTWSESNLYLRASTRLASALVLFGGLSYTSLNGDERITGATRSTTDFNNNGAGASIGIDYEIEPRGHIGVIAETGLRKGGQIYLLHRY